MEATKQSEAAERERLGGEELQQRIRCEDADIPDEELMTNTQIRNVIIGTRTDGATAWRSGHIRCAWLELKQGINSSKILSRCLLWMGLAKKSLNNSFGDRASSVQSDAEKATIGNV